MSLPFRRRSRPRGQARLALAGDFPDPDQTITDMLHAAGPADWDGTTIEFTGASIIGLPEGVHAFAVKQHGSDTEPLARYQPAPAAFRALPDADYLPPVPVTMPAVIGDELRLPVIWCEMPGCIGWHHDPASAGFADARDHADAAGWRTDALGRLACPDCQQGRADYRTPQPVTWHHPAVARGWHERGDLPSDDALFRLEVKAEYGKQLTWKNYTLACTVADATRRTAAS